MGRLVEFGGKLRHPRDVIRLAAERLAGIDHKMLSGWREIFLRRQHQLEKVGSGLALLSPKAVLGRGYALVQDASGRVIMKPDEAKRGDKLKIEFQEGKLGVVVE
jgi:exodeoxyribonuclease VII large subunit